MLWFAIVVAIVALLAAGLSLVLMAYGPRMGYTLREPTDDEAQRLRRLRDDDVPEAAIRITSGDGTPKFDVIGLPGRRRLVVTDAAMEQLDDDALRALLAVEDQRARSGIELTQAAVSGIAVGIFVMAYVIDVAFFPAMVGAWAVVLVGIALARRQHYGVDAAVADDLGRKTLQNALERVAELRGDPQESGQFWRAALEVEPSVGARLERLER